jgi:hypothetical protein
MSPISGLVADIIGALLDPIVLVIALTIGAVAKRWTSLVIGAVIAGLLSAFFFSLIGSQGFRASALFGDIFKLSAAYILGAALVLGARTLWRMSKPTFSA